MHGTSAAARSVANVRNSWETFPTLGLHEMRVSLFRNEFTALVRSAAATSHILPNISFNEICS